MYGPGDGPTNLPSVALQHIQHPAVTGSSPDPRLCSTSDDGLQRRVGAITWPSIDRSYPPANQVASYLKSYYPIPGLQLQQGVVTAGWKHLKKRVENSMQREYHTTKGDGMKDCRGTPKYLYMVYFLLIAVRADFIIELLQRHFQHAGEIAYRSGVPDQLQRTTPSTRYAFVFYRAFRSALSSFVDFPLGTPYWRYIVDIYWVFYHTIFRKIIMLCSYDSCELRRHVHKLSRNDLGRGYYTLALALFLRIPRQLRNTRNPKIIFWPVFIKRYSGVYEAQRHHL